MKYSGRPFYENITWFNQCHLAAYCLMSCDWQKSLEKEVCVWGGVSSHLCEFQEVMVLIWCEWVWFVWGHKVLWSNLSPMTVSCCCLFCYCWYRFISFGYFLFYALAAPASVILSCFLPSSLYKKALSFKQFSYFFQEIPQKEKEKKRKSKSGGWNSLNCHRGSLFAVKWG